MSFASFSEMTSQTTTCNYYLSLVPCPSRFASQVRVCWDFSLLELVLEFVHTKENSIKKEGYKTQIIPRRNTMSITKLEHLINDTVTKLNEADSIVSMLENIRWISPAGDLYIEPRGIILEMIETGSWR